MVVRIGELAERTGVATRLLRYYEERELLTPDRAASLSPSAPPICCAASRHSPPPSLAVLHPEAPQQHSQIMAFALRTRVFCLFCPRRTP